MLGAGVIAVVLKSPSHLRTSGNFADRFRFAQPVADITTIVPTPTPTRTPEPSPTPVPEKPKLIKKKIKVYSDRWAGYGYDISWPQCGPHGPILPPARGSTGIVGITGGMPFTVNPCLGRQWSWARTKAHHSGYINLASPTSTYTNPAGYGAATVQAALSEARRSGVTLTGAWLDVEVGNSWSHNRSENYAVVLGAIAALQAANIQPGIYTTPRNWQHLTGDAHIAVPLWLAVYDPSTMVNRCSGHGVGGRYPDMVQAVVREGGTEFDWSLHCSSKPDFLLALG